MSPGTGGRALCPGSLTGLATRPSGSHAATDGGNSLGITASRKVGNAVARNRARRRLREVARLVLPASAAPGQDYVLVGRAATLQRPFAMLVADLDAALARLRARRPAGAVAMQEDGRNEFVGPPA